MVHLPLLNNFNVLREIIYTGGLKIEHRNAFLKTHSILIHVNALEELPILQISIHIEYLVNFLRFHDLYL